MSEPYFMPRCKTCAFADQCPLKGCVETFQAPFGMIRSVPAASVPAAPVTTEQSLRNKIRAFFLRNPRPSDNEVHAMAAKLGINKHRFEEIIYAMLADALRGQKV